MVPLLLALWHHIYQFIEVLHLNDFLKSFLHANYYLPLKHMDNNIDSHFEIQKSLIFVHSTL